MKIVCIVKNTANPTNPTITNYVFPNNITLHYKYLYLMERIIFVPWFKQRNLLSSSLSTRITSSKTFRYYIRKITTNNLMRLCGSSNADL